MKQVLVSITSYGKRLLGQLGLGKQMAEVKNHHRREEGAWRVERRREARRSRIGACPYAMVRSMDRDGLILEEGLGAAVNESAAGMRLLLGIAPPPGQLMELQPCLASAADGHYLAEVCWTRPLREDEQGRLYLVGCRLNFKTLPGRPS